MKSYRKCQNRNTTGYWNSKSILDNPNSGTLEELKEKFTTMEGTRAETYRSMNPQLKVHEVYTRKDYIDERKRILFSKFRLSSHRLKIETGRWARLPRENRLCECGNVQDEEHVLLVCEKTVRIRGKYDICRNEYKDIGELMENCECQKLIDFMDECMKEF